jgi:hypothetical protein
VSLRLKRDTDFLAGTLHFIHVFCIKKSLTAWAAWISLEGHKLMDYSFLVAIKVGADGLQSILNAVCFASKLTGVSTRLYVVESPPTI